MMEKIQLSFRVTAKQSCLPVISLEFVSIGQTDFLLAGEGPYLKLFSRDGLLHAKEEVLPFRRVHGIRPAPLSVCKNQEETLLLVFGQKALRLVQLVAEGACFKLTPLCGVMDAPDWILDVCWLSFTDTTNFALSYITAHNAVTVYRVTSGTVTISAAHSEVNSILYSARLLSHNGDTLLAVSGTVFNQILLWTVNIADPIDPSSRIPVRLSLSGHEGVIFSVRFSEDRGTLVSVSDDRTVRVWSLPHNWLSLTRAEQRGSGLVLYGHMARVWDARLLPSVIVSIGEDATCRVWDYRGREVGKVEGHRGRSIWSMAVDSDKKMVATGGGDCSVRLFSLESLQEERKWSRDTHLISDDLPRSVCLHGNTALCHTNSGSLYAAQMSETMSETPVWREVHRDKAFSSYCVTTLSSDTHTLALGSLEGLVKLLSLDGQGSVVQETKWKAHSGKVFSLDWSSLGEGRPHELLVSCGPEGSVTCWRCESAAHSQELTVTSLATLELPPSKHRWVSAMLALTHSTLSNDTISHTLILGDRKGSLHVYKARLDPPPEPSPIKPVSSYRVHGPNGVMCVKLNGGCVYSAGRDGHCRRYKLSKDGYLTELTKFKPVKGMDWIENVYFLKEDTLVLGFHTTDMVLYSTAQSKCVARINCGGGHRSYGINSLEKILSTRMLCVVYVKQKALCLRASGLTSYFTRPILQPAFVGREAISLEILDGDLSNGDLLVAVGSEDCSVGLVTVSPLNSTIRMLKRLTGHLSSVKALSSSTGRKGALLFSGGARASLKAWLIPSASSLLNSEEISLCGEIFLHGKQHFKRQKAREHDTPECRVMSLASLPLSSGSEHYVAAGCSDGVIRQFIFEEESRGFRPQPSLEYHNRCVLCVKCSILSPHHSGPPLSLLFSSATDGHVAVWSLVGQLEQSGVPPGEEQLSLQPVVVFKAHQSGVNDIAVSYQESRLCVVTGGDDNKLTVSLLCVETTPVLSVALDHQYSSPSTHSSSITGVGWLGAGVVVSASIDQRLNVWRVGSRSLSLCSSHTHDVADLAALKVHSTSERMAVVLCGIGLQCLLLETAETDHPPTTL